MNSKYNICSKMWTDVNINFQRQTFQHCCKQIHSKISFDEIDTLGKDVFQKHKSIVSDRKISIEEDRLPPSCKWCIDTAPNNIKKVWNIWSDDWIDDNIENLYTENYVTYIDLDIGKSCDLACVYCGPWSSTTWAKELDQPTNSTIDTVWKDKILANLREYITTLDCNTKIVFNILGGEPLLITDTYDIIKYISVNCGHLNHKPDMMITTNLNCKPALLKKLLLTMDETADTLNWVLSVSIEDIGDRAEAVRYHIDFKRFENNLRAVIGKPHMIYLTVTLSILSFANLGEFIDWSFDIMGEEKYTNDWNFSLNNVQEGYTDLAYCPKQLIDIETIKSKFRDNAAQSGRLNKFESVISHLDNMYERAGTKEIDSKFIKWWEAMGNRRNMNYFAYFPMTELKNAKI